MKTELTKNLTLTYITENNAQGGQLITVECGFEFFGSNCTAFVVLERVTEDEPRYAMIESDESDLHESFCEVLERDEVWQMIVAEIKKYAEQWAIENAEYDFDEAPHPSTGKENEK